MLRRPWFADLVGLGAFCATAFTAIDSDQLALPAIEWLLLPDRPLMVPAVTQMAAFGRGLALEGKDVCHEATQLDQGGQA